MLRSRGNQWRAYRTFLSTARSSAHHTGESARAMRRRATGGLSCRSDSDLRFARPPKRHCISEAGLGGNFRNSRRACTAIPGNRTESRQCCARCRPSLWRQSFTDGHSLPSRRKRSRPGRIRESHGRMADPDQALVALARGLAYLKRNWQPESIPARPICPRYHAEFEARKEFLHKIRLPCLIIQYPETIIGL